MQRSNAKLSTTSQDIMTHGISLPTCHSRYPFFSGLKTTPSILVEDLRKCLQRSRFGRKTLAISAREPWLGRAWNGCCLGSTDCLYLGQWLGVDKMKCLGKKSRKGIPVGHLPFSDLYFIYIHIYIEFWGLEVGFSGSTGCCDYDFQVWWNDLMGAFHAAIGRSGHVFFSPSGR